MVAERKRLVRRIVPAALVLLLALGLAGPAAARPGGGRTPGHGAAGGPPAADLDQLAVTRGDNVVLRWNAAALEAVRATAPAPPVATRALAVVHTAMFDAWAAYDRWAVGTRLRGSLRRPARERTPANKREAVSYAAFRALVDLFPTRADDFTAGLRALGYDPANRSTDATTPAGVGNTAAAALLAYRHRDGSNQLGDLAPGPYADWTGYQPVNTADLLGDPSRWQPQRLPDGTVQAFAVPHWGRVKPFSMRSGAGPRATPPLPHNGAEHLAEVDELVELSAALDDRTKAIAEYWSGDPRPDRWNRIASWVSKRDHHSLDADVKLFFALANAQFDAGIAAWDAKRRYDSERPVTGVRFLRQGQTVSAWGGPYQGTREIPAEQWQPYVRAGVGTPPFPDHVSDRSAAGAASATVLAALTGSDRFGASATVPRGSSLIEPGATPATDVTLSWPTFSAAADEAGMSGRYAGVDYRAADLAGRILGRQVGVEVLVEAMNHIWGVGPVVDRLVGPVHQTAPATAGPPAPRPARPAASPPPASVTPPPHAEAAQAKVGGYHPSPAGPPAPEPRTGPWPCHSRP